MSGIRHIYQTREICIRHKKYIYKLSINSPSIRRNGFDTSQHAPSKQVCGTPPSAYPRELGYAYGYTPAPGKPDGREYASRRLACSPGSTAAAPYSGTRRGFAPLASMANPGRGSRKTLARKEAAVAAQNPGSS